MVDGPMGDEMPCVAFGDSSFQSGGLFDLRHDATSSVTATTISAELTEETTDALPSQTTLVQPVLMQSNSNREHREEAQDEPLLRALPSFCDD